MGRAIWVVEEIDSESGKTLYKQTFQTYEDANDTYDERKHLNEDNFVSLYKNIMIDKE